MSLLDLLLTGGSLAACPAFSSQNMANGAWFTAAGGGTFSVSQKISKGVEEEELAAGFESESE